MHQTLQRHREFVRFVLVGGLCFTVCGVINYGLRFTLLPSSPVTALTLGNVVATVVSYLLNRNWSFGGRGRGHQGREMLAYFLISALSTLVNDVPISLAHYLFELRTPYVSRLVQEVSDFVSGVVLGTAVAMVFRWWAFSRLVFARPAVSVPEPRRELERVG